MRRKRDRAQHSTGARRRVGGQAATPIGQAVSMSRPTRCNGRARRANRLGRGAPEGRQQRSTRERKQRTVSRHDNTAAEPSNWAGGVPGTVLPSMPTTMLFTSGCRARPAQRRRCDCISFQVTYVLGRSCHLIWESTMPACIRSSRRIRLSPLASRWFMLETHSSLQRATWRELQAASAAAFCHPR